MLCRAMIAVISCGPKLLKSAHLLRKEVRRIIMLAEAENRYQIKLKMLRIPAWRWRVLKDLGGVEALLRLLNKRVKPPKTVHRNRLELSEAEQKSRAHARLCAKACAHSNIRRDPFRVDQAGLFRLPPLPRQRGEAPQAQKNRAYRYDARPLNNFTGLNQPITVWPEEFIVFTQMDMVKVATKVYSKRRFQFVQKWLSALLGEVADIIPRVETELNPTAARAPP